jgi:hypothetical protein
VPGDPAPGELALDVQRTTFDEAIESALLERG